MGVFRYLVKGQAGSVTDEAKRLKLIKDAGLSYLVEGERSPCMQYVDVDNVPDFGPGVCFSVWTKGMKDPGGLAGWRKDQTWDKSGDVWIGFDNGNSPTPSHLERAKPVDGEFVELGDGSLWRIPKARVWPKGTRLPSNLFKASDGTVMYRVMPRYTQLCSDAYLVFDEMIAAHDRYIKEQLTGQDQPKIETSINLSKMFDISIESLSVNYRISDREASMLGLITSQNIQDIQNALVDWKTFEAFVIDEQKKKTGRCSSGSET